MIGAENARGRISETALLLSVVIYDFIGLGEPPLSIPTVEPSLTHCQFIGVSKGISSSIQVISLPIFS